MISYLILDLTLINKSSQLEQIDPLIYDKILMSFSTDNNIIENNNQILKSLGIDSYIKMYQSDDFYQNEIINRYHLLSIFVKSLISNKKAIKYNSQIERDHKYLYITKIFNTDIFNSYVILDEYSESKVIINFDIIRICCKAHPEMDNIHNYRKKCLEKNKDIKFLLVNVTFKSSFVISIFYRLYDKRILIGKGQKIFFDVISHSLLTTFEFEFELTDEIINKTALPYVQMEYLNIEIKENNYHESNTVIFNCYSDTDIMISEKRKTFINGLFDNGSKKYIIFTEITSLSQMNEMMKLLN
jgi:hypothetical protein